MTFKTWCRRRIWKALFSSSPAIIMVILLFMFPIIAMAEQFPDTGQTKCYNNVGEIPCPEPGEAFYGQDAQYAALVRSYTKLGQNGIELPDTATQNDGWIMTRDNVTGLIWEIKTDDGSIHDKDNSYTWSNARKVFIAQLNQQRFGGFSDWRMPTINELSSLVNNGIPSQGPTIDTRWFPRTVSFIYWSSTANAYYKNAAWRVKFGYGGVYDDFKSYRYFVRAVRSGK